MRKGTKHTPEARALIKEKRKLQKFSEETKERLREARKKRIFTPQMRANMREGHLKKVRLGTHHLWKGGVTIIYQQIRNTLEYRQWRSDVYERDDYTCQVCGVRGGTILNVDHIKPLSKIVFENNIKNI